LLLEADFNPDSSGRRKRVSARHQVKRLDRIFERVRSFESRSGRRNKFSSFGADLKGPQFHPAPKPQVKSGPDVFADALVQSAAWLMPGALIFSKSHISSFRMVTREAAGTRAYAVTRTRCTALAVRR
jgi:hypothetical protein